MSGSIRWAYGTLAAAALTASYEVASFPRQTDQPGIVDWLLDLDESDVYLEQAEMVDALDLSRGGFGDGLFTLVSGVLTPGMVQYLRSSRFQGLYSAPATVMTRRRDSLTMRYMTVNCTAHWPDLSREATPDGDGYVRAKFVFTGATLAGRAFSSAFSSAFG